MDTPRTPRPPEPIAHTPRPPEPGVDTPRPPGVDDTDVGPAGSLPLTGERTVPGIPDENYWFQRHVAAYDHVAARVHGTVLDAGCGEGYGLVILHDAGARGVIGVELDPLVADHARRRHAHDGIPDIDVVEADLDDLPLVDDTLDAAVCLQVVEHLSAPGAAVAELARVVHPGGEVVVSTPNRLTFSPDTDVPTNPFHHREYAARELAGLLSSAGLVVDEVLGVHHRPDLAGRLAALVGDDPTTVLADATTWDVDVRALVHGVTAADFRVVGDDEAPLAGCLDLVAWARVPR